MIKPILAIMYAPLAGLSLGVLIGYFGTAIAMRRKK